MTAHHASLVSKPQRPLAVCVAALTSVAAGTAMAQVTAIEPSPSIVVVQNCNDSGAGSLRAAFANAADGETIDLSQLVCSRITLGSALVDPIAATSVTLIGPGRDQLAIDGDDRYRVLVHRGAGELRVESLTITNGHYAGAHGGCVYSAGDVRAIGSVIASCVLDTLEPAATGGAIYAKALVGLYDSTVRDSSATAPGGYNSRGGGIYSAGFVMSRSTVSGNSAGKGGGIHTSGGIVDIEDSTLSGNHALYGGALVAPALGAHQIRNSTLSGNTAKLYGGAIYADLLTMYNCTIAGNVIASPLPAGAGLFVTTLTLQSSIVANNTADNGLLENDVVAFNAIAGSNNLIMASTGPVPAGTITVDPKLGPLQANGGATWTHALPPGSPAIDKGSNLLQFDGDQRGARFGRVAGSGADIGAFEFTDTLFRSDFEPVEIAFSARSQ